MVKILHTSDWHLGKKWGQHSLIEEQRKFLNWLIKETQIEKPDALVISGDIYDVPSPPFEAQEIFIQFLEDVDTLQIPCLIIAGNHDSGRFLEIPRPLIKNRHIQLIGTLERAVQKEPLELEDVHIYALPYFSYSDVCSLLQAWDIKFDPLAGEENIRLFLKHYFKRLDPTKKNILMAHHQFGQFKAAGSEEPLFLSGLHSLSPQWFDVFDVLLLGHMHGFQKVSSHPLAIYSGAPLPMRPTEKKQKHLHQLAIGEEIISKKIAIPEFRKIIHLKGNATELKKQISPYHEGIYADSLPPYFYCEMEANSTQDLEDLEEIQAWFLSPHTSFKGQIKFLNSSSLMESEEDSIDLMGIENQSDLLSQYIQKNHPTASSSSLMKEFRDVLSEMEQN